MILFFIANVPLYKRISSKITIVYFDVSSRMRQTGRQSLRKGRPWRRLFIASSYCHHCRCGGQCRQEERPISPRWKPCKDNTLDTVQVRVKSLILQPHFVTPPLQLPSRSFILRGLPAGYSPDSSSSTHSKRFWTMGLRMIQVVFFYFVYNSFCIHDSFI